MFNYPRHFYYLLTMLEVYGRTSYYTESEFQALKEFVESNYPIYSVRKCNDHICETYYVSK